MSDWVKCDDCERESDARHKKLWIRVTNAPDWRSTTERVFCSIDCLLSWTTKAIEERAANRARWDEFMRQESEL